MRLSTSACLAACAVVALFAIGCTDSTSPATPTPAPTPAPAPAPAPAPPASITDVSIPQGAATLTLTAYNPNPVNVAVGTTVRWTNTDSVPHTSTSDGAGWNSGTLAAGAQFDFTFATAGTFPYHCAIHPGMVGTIVAR